MYERCGFDASSSPTTLYMLSDLEARLEDLLSDIAQMPEEYVAKAEKVCIEGDNTKAPYPVSSRK